MQISQKLDLLMRLGEARGLPVSYRALSAATGESANNIRKIHVGLNTNPGFRILSALTSYFGTDLGYFQCKSPTACRDYLERSLRERLIQRLERGSQGLSEEALDFIAGLMDYVRRAEGLPPIANT